MIRQFHLFMKQIRQITNMADMFLDSFNVNVYYIIFPTKYRKSKDRQFELIVTTGQLNNVYHSFFLSYLGTALMRKIGDYTNMKC